MADAEKKTEDAAAEAAPKRKPKALILGGGGVAVVALAWIAATVALPSKPTRTTFSGPFVAPLTEEKIQVNLSDSKSFLVVNLNVLFEAVSRSYYDERSADEVYVAELKDALVNIASSKTREEMSDKVGKPIFIEEVHRAVEPLLFPLHVGATRRPYDRDGASGLAPGLSSASATLRAPFGEHVLRVDAPQKTVRVDDGPATAWQGGETDLRVESADGEIVWLDVSQVEADFVGEVPIGVQGRVRQIKWSEILIQ